MYNPTEHEEHPTISTFFNMAASNLVNGYPTIELENCDIPITIPKSEKRFTILPKAEDLQKRLQTAFYKEASVWYTRLTPDIDEKGALVISKQTKLTRPQAEMLLPDEEVVIAFCKEIMAFNAELLGQTDLSKTYRSKLQLFVKRAIGTIELYYQKKEEAAKEAENEAAKKLKKKAGKKTLTAVH